MPVINFGNVPYPKKKSFSPLPPGKYRAFCKTVQVSYNQHGIEQWDLKLEVIDGEHAGQWVFDSLYWGSKRDEKANVEALSRCKLVCHRLGGLRVDEMGELEVRPEDLQGKTCVINTKLETHDREGKPLLKGPRARVHFDGYEVDGPPAAEPGVEEVPLGDQEVPF